MERNIVKRPDKYEEPMKCAVKEYQDVKELEDSHVCGICYKDFQCESKKKLNDCKCVTGALYCECENHSSDLKGSVKGVIVYICEECDQPNHDSDLDLDELEATLDL